MISELTSSYILTVGENYKNHRGGIAGVINTYSRFFAEFKFVSTYKPQPNKLLGIPYFFLGSLLLTYKLIADKKIQLVHIHGAAKGSIFRKYIILIISKYLFKRKVIYHCHGSEFEKFYNQSNWLFKKIISSLINNADLIICLSIQWESFFRKNFNAKEIIVLENIIEPTVKIERISKKEKLTVLFLGYIGARKGIFDLLEVIKDNKQILDNRIELIIGGNGQVKQLEEYINTYNLSSLVKYAGWVSGEKKHELLSNANLYVLPSHNEGLPLSILEAMSYNLPIISTPVGGITEVVHDKINGFIVQPGDKKSLLQKLLFFIDHPGQLNIMGNESSRIIQPYYASSVIPKLEKIYTRILNKKSKKS